MALTINAQPSASYFAISRMATNLSYQVTSNDSDCENIIADVFLDSVYAFTVTVPANQALVALFNFRNAATDHVAAKMKGANFGISALTGTSAAAHMQWFYATIQVDFFEELRDADGVLTSAWAANGAGTPDAQSNTVRYTTMIPNLSEAGNIGDAYQMPAGSDTHSKLFLTNRPRPSRVALGGRDVLYYFITNGTQAGAVRVSKYDAGGSLLGTMNVTIPANRIGVHATECGPVNLNAHTAGFIDEAVAYYTVEVRLAAEEGPPVRKSEIFRFDVERAECAPVHEVQFWNHRGGFDTYTFRDEIKRIGGNGKVVMQRFTESNQRDVSELEVQRVDPEQRFDVLNYVVDEPDMEWLREMFETAKAFVWIGGQRYATIVLPKQKYTVESSDGFVEAIRLEHQIRQRGGQRL